MQITLETKPFAALETEALVSYVFEETDPVQGRIAEIDQSAASLLRKLAKSGELTGKMLEFTLVHAPAGLEVHIGVANVGLSFPERLHLRAVQHQSGLMLLKNMVVIRSRAVLRDDLLAGLFRLF